MGTARTKPNPPHNQDQNIMAMVTESAFTVHPLAYGNIIKKQIIARLLK